VLRRLVVRVRRRLGRATTTAVVGVLPQLADNAELPAADVALERSVARVCQSVVDPALPQRVLATAVVTAVSLLRRVDLGVSRAPVRLQSPRPRERLATRRTDVSPHDAVYAGVLAQLARLSEPLRTRVARKRLLAGVDSLVLDELAADDEPARTQAARERLHSGVRATVIVQRRGRRHDPITLTARIRPRAGSRRPSRRTFALPPRRSSLSVSRCYDTGQQLSSTVARTPE